MYHSALHTYLTKYHLDVILITNLFNVRYLSGFTGTNGLILITKNKQFFFTDSRYTEQAKRQVKGFTLVRSDRDIFNTILKILKTKQQVRLGFEAGATTHAHYLRLKKGLKGVTLVPITEDTAEMRIIKTKSEIKKLERALRINKLAFDEIRPQIKPGKTEIEIARALEMALLKYGAEKIGFDTIVASGWRGALPHGVASEKKIKAGELVTIDFGGVYQGYHADETVTVLVERRGAITPSSVLPLVGGGKRYQSLSPQRGERHREGSRHQLDIYQTVLDAQRLALKQVRPGAKCSDIDKAARDYITKKGYGQYFGHALGHGVGLEVHERPVLSQTSKDILEEGMIFTIEPGIYIPGWGGVRLEDVFVCTKQGAKRLSYLKKSL